MTGIESRGWIAAVVAVLVAAQGVAHAASSKTVPAKMITADPTPGRFYQVDPGDGIHSVIAIAKAAGVEWRWVEASDWNKDRYFDPSISDNVRPNGGLSMKPKFAAGGAKTKSRTVSKGTGSSYALLWIPSREGEEPFETPDPPVKPKVDPVKPKPDPVTPTPKPETNDELRKRRARERAEKRAQAEKRLGATVDKIVKRIGEEATDSTQQARMTCFLDKVKGSGVDGLYLSWDRVHSLVNKQTDSCLGYIDGSGPELAEDLRTDLLDAMIDSSDFEDLMERVYGLDNAVAKGLTAVARMYNLHGDQDACAKGLHQWSYKRQQHKGWKEKSILSCFAD